MHTIFTVGYQSPGWTPQNLLAELERLDAILWDIRWQPYSSIPGWSQVELQRLLRDRYRHIKALGNDNFRGGTIKLNAPASILSIAGDTLAMRPIVMLCGCRDVETCHRLTASEFVAQRLRTSIVHLDAPAIVTSSGLVAITVKQPWAWALIFGGKDIENRDWRTNYRGPIAIHAASRTTRSDHDAAAMFMRNRCDVVCPEYDDLSRGTFQGVMNLTDCVDTSSSYWWIGKHGFVMKDPKPLPEPIPYKGMLGIWPVPEDVAQQIREAL
jgi:ASCH domain